MTTANADTLNEKGYVLIEDVVAPSLCQAVVELICNYLDVPSDRSLPDFKRVRGEVYNGIVPLHQHQALWDTRQAPGMHAAFASIYGTERLWVTMDRASYKPRLSPRASAKPGDANRIHVDHAVMDTATRPVQGVLYLTDTAADQGAWECVPGLFEATRSGRSRFSRGQDLGDHEVVRVPGPAGSLVIWDERMPHSSGHNWTDTPRFAQYITMHPAGDEATRTERISWWRERRAPPYWRGMKNQEDPEPWAQPAHLSELGRKILGDLPW